MTIKVVTMIPTRWVVARFGSEIVVLADGSELARVRYDRRFIDNASQWVLGEQIARALMKDTDSLTIADGRP